MFEQFNDAARRCVVLAQEEARRLGHDFIGSEHLLLGLLSDGEGPACIALAESGVSLTEARERAPGVRGLGASGHIPFDAPAKAALENSQRRAIELGNHYIGTGHILLGLLELEEAAAASVMLRDLRCDIDRLKARTVELVNVEAETENDRPELTPLRGSVAAHGFAVAAPVGTTRGAVCSFCGRDVWELQSFVASGEARICNDCVAASARAMSEATPTDQPIVLPPRVFGSDPPDDGSVGEIVATFTRAFDATASDASRAEAIEDGGLLMTLVRQASERHPGTGGAVVRGVRFANDEHAQVRFVLQFGSGGMAFEGDAVREDGRWQVSRSTMCRLLSMAGIPCPPR